MLPPAVYSLVDSFDGPQTLFSFSVDIFVDGQPSCSSIRAGLLLLPASALDFYRCQHPGVVAGLLLLPAVALDFCY